jgi:hypothetical protein
MCMFVASSPCPSSLVDWLETEVLLFHLPFFPSPFISADV